MDELKERILRKIEYELKKGFSEYFSYEWRDRIGDSIGDMLDTNSRFVKLAEWFQREINLRIPSINVLCPADRETYYTVGIFRTYKETMADMAIMIHFRELLLDNRTTDKMRGEIEYAAGRIFGVRYNEITDSYCAGTDEV